MYSVDSFLRQTHFSLQSLDSMDVLSVALQGILVIGAILFLLFFKQNKPKEMEGYVGFANLPNQVYRRSVKRGFEFTLMVVGKCKLKVIFSTENKHNSLPYTCL